MRQSQMSVTFILAVTALVATLSLPSFADIPQVISYQGKVTDTSGVPVEDGGYTMRFLIYNAASGGTLRWNSGNATVQVSAGLFHVLLGASPQLPMNLPFDEDYWLLVIFSGVHQTPRQQLASAGYAYMASGLVPGTEVSGSVTGGTLAAIKARNTATTGAGYGICGESASTAGYGVYGVVNTTIGANYGVYGRSVSTAGCGVLGWAAATTGTTYGAEFVSSSTSGYGVYGWANTITGTNYGVAGQSNSTNGRAVYGHAIATTGECYGGRFENGSSSGRGVFGHAYSGTGTTYGVYGQSNSAAGYGIYYSGGLAGSGSKNCVVRTSQGPTLMYCQESTESWFEDFGEGRLVNGKAHIELDHLFLETVTIDDANRMKVFVEFDHERCQGAAVKRGFTGFDLVERNGGTTTCSFWYRVVAKRKGFESKRLDYCRAAETDSYLYPELREKELRELENEKARMEKERHGMEEERAQQRP